MAFPIWKLVGGSKLLLLPLTGLVAGGAGAAYGTYRISRSWTGGALGVDFEEAGTICQGVATVGGAGAAAGFLLARHSNYRPLPFKTILEQMESELFKSDQSVTKTVNSSGTIISSQTNQANARPPPTAPKVHGWLHAMRHRTRLFLRAARVPARFYAINTIGAALLTGSVTSVAQRVVCGKTGSADEVGKMPAEKEKAAAAAAAARPTPIAAAVVLPPTPVVAERRPEPQPIAAAPVHMMLTAGGHAIQVAPEDDE